MLEFGTTRVVGWKGEAELSGGTVFGLVTDASRIVMGPDHLLARAGSFFVSPEPVQVTCGVGLAIVVGGYLGLRQVGGPLEATGRLRYIDGCTDTLLVSPPRRGEPCLNHLHVPPWTNQSFHTHDTARVGVIVRGRGHCRTQHQSIALSVGCGWFIPPGLRHCFVTGDESLDVMAWHPDSDFGPTDEYHPMLNKTVLNP